MTNQDIRVCGGHAKCFADALGGDKVASRIVSALQRDGIATMDGLDRLLNALGEHGLRERLLDVRNIGDKAMDRIIEALTAYSATDAPSSCADDRPFPSLPDGLSDRLLGTIEQMEAEGDNVYDLTQADLRALLNLLH